MKGCIETSRKLKEHEQGSDMEGVGTTRFFLQALQYFGPGSDVA